MKKTLLSIAVSATLAGAAPFSTAGELKPELMDFLNVQGPGLSAVPLLIKFKNSGNVEAKAEQLAALGLDQAGQRYKLIRWMQNRTMANAKKVEKYLDDNGVTDKELFWLGNGMYANVPPEMVNDLAAFNKVQYLQLDLQATLEYPTPGGGAPVGWNLDAVGVPAVWQAGFHGQGAVVGVMDTGVDIAHPDLAASWRGGSNSWYDPNGEYAAPYDSNGHGTQALGLIVGTDGSGLNLGVAPGAQWIAAKIFDGGNEATYSAIHSAFQWMLDPDGNPAVDDAPDVVNNSWGFPETYDLCDSEFSEDIAALRAAGVSVVFAAGNSGPGSASSISPANDLGALPVGSVDSNLKVSYFSSRGPGACGNSVFPSISAPGEAVLTTDLTFGGVIPYSYMEVSGTSFAAPHISGALALLKSAGSGLSMAELESALQNTAVDLGSAGPDDDYGVGLMDVSAAFYQISGGEPPAQPGSIAIDQSQYEVAEDGLSLTISLLRSGGSDGPVSVLYTTADGSATAGEDYAATSGTLDFADGQTAVDVVVDLIDDSVVEANETFRLSISDPAGGATLGSPAAADVTITDNDVDPAGPVDMDGDGYTDDVDCDDTDAGVHPGASEIKSDGIDQDCNGYDLTINVSLAKHVASQDKLIVNASSDLGKDANLELVGYGAMKWQNKKSRWRKVVKPAGGYVPIVTISGVEGEVEKAVKKK